MSSAGSITLALPLFSFSMQTRGDRKYGSRDSEAMECRDQTRVVLFHILSGVVVLSLLTIIPA